MAESRRAASQTKAGREGGVSEWVALGKEAQALFKPPLADGNLTWRQQSILNLVRSHARKGVSSEQAGAFWHSLRSKHSPEDRCRFCAKDGRSILVALRKRGLVKQRRPDGTWSTTSPPPRAGYDPATAAIPF